VYFDSDLILHKEIWKVILNTKPGEFRMYRKSENPPMPCTRVLSIHKQDFWRMGGFDETIQLAGEDRVFFLEAVYSGLRYVRIPSRLVEHIAHVTRGEHHLTAIKMIWEGSRLGAKYGIRYESTSNSKKQWIRNMIVKRVRTMHFRTVVIHWFA